MKSQASAAVWLILSNGPDQSPARGWKYQVLFDLPKFHKIYAVHQGILSEVENPQHLKRKEKFTHCIKQVEEWILNNATPKHAEEIELNIQDIKIYLQEFLQRYERR